MSASEVTVLNDSTLHSDVLTASDMAIVLSNGESLVSVRLPVLFASMFLLSPGSKVITTWDSGNFTLGEWIIYSKRPTDSWIPAPSYCAVNDIFLRLGITSDTHQRVVYMARIIQKETLANSSLKIVVKPIVTMIEGEPPIWGTQSST